MSENCLQSQLPVLYEKYFNSKIFLREAIQRENIFTFIVNFVSIWRPSTK